MLTLLERDTKNDLSKETRTALWTLLVVAFAACSPAPTPTVTPTSSAATATIRLPIQTPARTFAPIATSSSTPLVPTSSPAPSVAPISSPTSAVIPFVPFTFRSIRMMDLKTGWAMANIESEDETHIFRTADGGATWLDVSPVEVDFAGSFFLDGQIAWGWARYDGQAWRTQDGGTSWTSVEDLDGELDLGFNDSQHGWKLTGAYPGPSFWHFEIVSFSTTEDGGQSWQDTTPPPDWGTAYMAYPSAQTAWALRAAYRIMPLAGVPNLGVPFRIQSTFDGGSTWNTREMPLPPEAFRIELSDTEAYLGGSGSCSFVSPVYSSTAFWKLALTCERRSWMYTTANQGQTWIISDMPAGLGADVQFIDASTGWLHIGDPNESSEGHLYQTIDGGQSWTLLKRTGWTEARLSFVDTQTGWAVACADTYFCVRQALIKTIDGGQSWQTLEPQLIP